VDTVKALRFVSIAEAISFILLLVATAVKYGAGHKQGVQVLGPIHGVLFIAYVALVFAARSETGWDNRRLVLGLVASVIPFAPLYVERNWLPRRAALTQAG
jgi:integral membrane protein